MASWSSIPLDLAGLILGRLPSHVDRVRFAAVCPQWRSGAHQVLLPPPLPLLALKEGDTFYSMPRGEPHRFALPKGDCDFLTTVCGNWLVYRRLHDLLLVDPFSSATMTLPAPGEDEGDDYMIGHESADKDDESQEGLDSAHESDDTEDGSVSTNNSDMFEIETKIKDYRVIKVILCSPNLIAALLQGVSENDSNLIAVCRPGASMWSVAWDLFLWITDMAFYQGKLYALDYHEDLLALHISVDDNTGDPCVGRIERVINVNQFDVDDDVTLKRILYLVESGGSLLLVRRRIFHTHVHGKGQIHSFAGPCEPDLVIFEADFGQSQWVKVTTLKYNQALFLGPCSRSVCMPQAQGDSPVNRVWFLDGYKDFHICNEWHSSSSSGTSSVAKPKPFSPLPMISWRGFMGNSGAAWLFPSN